MLVFSIFLRYEYLCFSIWNFCETKTGGWVRGGVVLAVEAWCERAILNALAGSTLS